jgi:RNA polymerase sigma factor (sigma-70 family)
VHRKRAEPSDAELLIASRAGHGGFSDFYRRRHGLVLAFLLKRASDRELAADLMAETFADALIAVQDRDRALPDVPVAWILTIAHRKLIASYRRGKVEADARERLQLEPLPIDDGDLRRVEEVAAEVDVMEQLRALLPPDQVEVLRARVLDGRPYEEIAGDLQCSQAVVRMRVSRALNTLRKTPEAFSR